MICDRIPSFICYPMIFLFGMVAMAVAQEVHSLECTSTTFIEVTDNCEECPVCPPVLQCPDGWSAACVEDSIEPPPPPIGEQQQYPPPAAEALVQSIVDGDLSDVSLTSDRWGNREEGEVYARENDNFLVFYWPKTGDALFDLTSLGDLVSWFDYRISSGISGGGDHTSMNVSPNSPIWFNDSGGGVTIFKRKNDVVEPPIDPPDQGGFLAPYVNPAQLSLPDRAGYPFGQRMWLSMYTDNSSQLDRMHDAGFTLSGPHYSGCGTDAPPNIAKTHSYGMGVFWRLHTVSGHWSGVLARMKTQEGRDYIAQRVKRCVDAVLNNDINNAAVVAWYGYPEEPINRTNQPIAAQREYMKFVRDLIVQLDPKKRPLFWSERGDSSAYDMKINAQFGAGSMKQNYLIKANNYDGDGKEWEERFLIGQWVRDMHNADDGNAYTGKVRPVVPTLSMYVDPDNTQYRTEAWLRKAITHDVYLSIAMGAHGLNTYTWHTSGIYSVTTKRMQENIYIDVIGRFSKETDFGKAFLWGDERNDVQVQITQGPKTFQWNKYSTTFTEPTLKVRNVQYGDKRYLLIVNSAKDAVSVKISGIPDGLLMRDIITGESQTVSGDMQAAIDSLGVRLYEATDGH